MFLQHFVDIANICHVFHTPVLLNEAIDLLDPKPGETVVDLTTGLGGHAKAFIERIGPRGKLICLDADEENLSESRKNISGKNVEFLHANFREISSLNLPQCDILFADLGVSSPHIDDPKRGFTFREESPLDCRFDQSRGEPASVLLQNASERELARIFAEYGELKHVRKLVRSIVTTRVKKPFLQSSDLVFAAESVFGWEAKKVLPQIFQAMRMAVNDEGGALTSLLDAGPSFLTQGGRFGMISYHSLEDRMVKQRFRSLSAEGAAIAPYTLLTKKPVRPSMQEISHNPRARSAVFRILQKQ